MQTSVVETDSAAVVVGYLHTQSSPSATWVVDHHLGLVPAVSVYIPGIRNGEEVVQVCLPSQVRVIDDNTVWIEFTSPRTGFARLV